MKSFVLIAFSLLFISPCLAQSGKKTCPENPDNSYDRQKTLERLADMLNDSIPEFGAFFKKGFSVENERGVLFFVHDLTDVSNKQLTAIECVDFVNDHIYHVAPKNSMFSFSHIVVLENGAFKAFKSVNCKEIGNPIEDVIKYLNQKLRDNEKRNEILERVKNYRKYGKYVYGDRPQLRCKGINN